MVGTDGTAAMTGKFNGCIHNLEEILHYMLNWMTEITDLLQFFVVSVKFGSDYASRAVVLSF